MDENTILTEAVKLAEKIGYKNITRGLVAKKLNIAPSHISYYFSTMGELKKQIMKKAVKDKNYKIIAMGILLKDPIALKSEYTLNIEGY